MENSLSEYEIVSDISKDKFSVEYLKDQKIKINEVKLKISGELYNDLIFDLSKEEAKNISNLNDLLNIFPKIRSHFEEEGKYHLIIENLSKYQSLNVYFIKNSTLIHEQKLASIIKQICASLKKLHEKNLILNNLSLDNIFYCDNDLTRKIIFINPFGLENSNTFTNDIKNLGEILEKMKNIKVDDFHLLNNDELITSRTKLLNQIKTDSNITIDDIIKSDYLKQKKSKKLAKSFLIETENIPSINTNFTNFNKSCLHSMDDQSSDDEDLPSSRTLNTNNDKFIKKVLKICNKSIKKNKISFEPNNEKKLKKIKNHSKIPNPVRRKNLQQIKTNMNKKPLEVIISDSPSMTLFNEALETTAKYSLPTKRPIINNQNRSFLDALKEIFN